MKGILQKQAWKRSVAWFVYSFIILCIAAWSLKRPAYNWDILPYMGIVLSYDDHDIKDVHQQVYRTAKEEVPAIYYQRMIDPSNAHRNSVVVDPELFRSQFPFYIVKPLYTRLVWFFYKTGMGLTIATVVPSIISYCLIAALLFYWIQKYSAIAYALLVSTLMMLSPPLLTIAGLSSPDALSGLFLFGAIYFFTETKGIVAVFVLLLLAVSTRLDNILPALIILSGLFFNDIKNSKIPAGRMAVMYLVLISAYFIVTSGARSFGWSFFYYPVFIKQLNTGYSFENSFSINKYLELAKSQLITGLYFSFLTVFFFLITTLLWKSSLFRAGKLSAEQLLGILFVFIMVIRFVLQPLVADRLYIPYYLSVVVFLIKKNVQPGKRLVAVI